MRNSEQYSQVIQEIDFLRAERRELSVTGPRFVVIHRGHQLEAFCLAGEVVEQVCLIHRWNQIPLRLSPIGLLIMDCFCRNRFKPLAALRIEQILKSDPFYTRQGANLQGGNIKVDLPKRSSIKVYVQRIREQMARIFNEVGLDLDSSRVLISETTDTNAVVYRLKASVEFVHRP